MSPADRDATAQSPARGSRVRRLTVDADAEGQRLDRWLRQRFPALGQGRIQRLLRTGQIRVDGGRAKASTRLVSGQEVRLPPLPLGAGETKPPAASADTAVDPDTAERLRRRVLYKDDWLIALDKPAGLAVQGGRGQRLHVDALLDALRFEAPERPRLVHRLDKDTSGVLLLARSARAARVLAESFRAKSTRKLYWAAVAGRPDRPQGLIDLPLAKQAGRRGQEKVATAGAGGQPALTLYRVAATAGRRASWLLLRPVSGRTHQLRAHCLALGTPILGDGKYGGRAAFLAAPDAPRARADWPRRLQLHAHEIALPHPEDGTTLRIRAPLPAHMEEVWRALGFDPDAGEAAADSLAAYAESLPELA